MFKFYPAVLALLLLCKISLAQTSSVSINYNNFTYAVCTNTTFSLPVVINGAFNANNQFKVEIRRAYSNLQTTEIPATLVAGALEFQISDKLSFNNTQIQLRIITSSPRTESDWSSTIAVHTKGSVEMNPSEKSDTLNAFDRVQVAFRGKSFQQTNITLSDSTKINFYASEQGFAQDQLLTIARSGTYTIAHAENFCGAMEVRGKYVAVVNAPSVRTLQVTPTAFCENSDLQVKISTNGSGFTSATRYKLRFTRITGSSEIPAVLETPATLEGNLLRAKFPANAKINGIGYYNVQVVTENPATVAAPYQSNIQVWAAPGATLNTESQTVDFNSYFSLRVDIKGMPPYSLELTDGTILNTSDSQTYINVSPVKNQSYSIKSVTTGCGKKEIQDPQVVEIKVRPGIRFATAERQNICAGSGAKIKILTNAPFTSETQFSVRMYSQFTGLTTIAPAQKNGDYIEFNLPPNERGYGGYGYQIVTTNPALQSEMNYNIVLQTPPNVQYTYYGNTTVFDKPQNTSIGIYPTGGSPYTIEYLDGTSEQTNYDGSNFLKNVFVKESMEFRIKSISNTCYTNNNPRSLNLSVTNSAAPALYLEPISKSVCDGDSIDIVFGSLGSFNPGNKFIIQGYGNCCEFQNIQTVEQGGKYKVRLKTDYWYSANGGIRIASTNPVLFSEIQTTTIQTALSDISIYPESSSKSPYVFLASEAQSFRIQSPYSNVGSVTYSLENGPDQVVYSGSGNASVEIPIQSPVGKMSVYKIKSAANACNTLPVNQEFYVTPTAYRIQLTSYNNELIFCPGDPFSFSFGIMQGNASANATFSLEVTEQNSTNKTVLVSGVKGNELKGIIPDDLAAGYYTIRVVSSEGPVSYQQNMRINKPATVTLRTETQAENISVEAGQNLNLKMMFTGTGPWTTVWQDNVVRNHYYSQEETISFNPEKSQEYVIKEVSNACGYGTVAGTVKVSVNPRLDLNSNSYFICPGGELSVTYKLAGDADLSNAFIRFSIIDPATNIETALDSTKTASGIILLKIPAELTGSVYTIRGTVAKYAISRNFSLNVTSKARLVISGNNTINAGSASQLLIKSTNNAGYVSFVLSDGTRGEVGTFDQNTFVRVSPAKTTTYTITSATNECGAGETLGSALVQVNPASERSVTVTRWSSPASGFCTGDTISVSYATTGQFSAGNVMTVQLSDSTGSNFKPITTIGSGNPLRAVVPSNLSATSGYRIRVMASDAGTASGAFENAISASQRAKARFASESVIFDGTTNPKITVLLEGGGPWRFRFGNDLQTQDRYTTNAVNEIEIFQASPNQYYRLFSVYNACGLGEIGTPSTVRVETVTASEPQLQFKVTVAPNPVQEILTVSFENQFAQKTLSLYNAGGQLLKQFNSRKISEEINIATLRTGIYLLVIESEGRRNVFKVAKQ